MRPPPARHSRPPPFPRALDRLPAPSFIALAGIVRTAIACFGKHLPLPWLAGCVVRILILRGAGLALRDRRERRWNPASRCSPSWPYDRASRSRFLRRPRGLRNGCFAAHNWPIPAQPAKTPAGPPQAGPFEVAEVRPLRAAPTSCSRLRRCARGGTRPALRSRGAPTPSRATPAHGGGTASVPEVGPACSGKRSGAKTPLRVSGIVWRYAPLVDRGAEVAARRSSRVGARGPRCATAEMPGSRGVHGGARSASANAALTSSPTTSA